MNENERRQRDFEAQRQRNRDDRANQQRKEQENRTWERNIARQEQLARQQREAFERQQAGFKKMGRDQAAKLRAEEQYRRQAQNGYTGTGTSGRTKNKVGRWVVLMFVVVTGILLAQGENFGSAIGGGFGVTAIILLGIAAVVLTLQAIGRAILRLFGRK